MDKQIFIFLYLLQVILSRKPACTFRMKTLEPILKKEFEYDELYSLYEVKLEDETLIENNKFYLVFELDDPNFVISILKSNDS